MKIKIVLFGILSVTSSFAFAIEFPPAPQKNYFSTAVWQERRVLEIPEGETPLTESTEISVDEVIVRGTLVTNGHQLKIDAIQITFENGGKIVAFSCPAQKGQRGLNGAGGFLATNVAGRGGDGEDGKKGFPGQDGHPDPGAIVIHAVKTVGVPMISGFGQTGGDGGQGGPGGRGGQGGKGQKGDTNCWGYRKNGGDGGQGGLGGRGGQGGYGGRGGSPVPVVFVTGNSKDVKYDHIVNGPGMPGAAGEPGEPGKPGPGGARGEGDSSGCGSWPVEWSVSSSAGNIGKLGPVQTATLGEGAPGALAGIINGENPYLKMFLDLGGEQPSPIIYSFDRLEVQRRKLIENWLFVHWSRNFILLVLETFAEIQSQQTDVEAVGSSNDLLSMLLKNTNKERAQLLAQLWQTQFIAPLESIKGSDPAYFTETELTAAKALVEMLALLSKDDAALLKAEIQSKLQSLQSTSQLQFESTLQTALEECKTYIDLLAGTDQRSLKLSPYYRVPVCSGQPDFTKQENIAAPILLFDQWKQSVPDSLISFTKTLAQWIRPAKDDSWLVSLVKRGMNIVLPQAFADYGFEAVVDAQENTSYEELPKSVPQTESWLMDGRGRLSGFKAVQKNLTESEIARELRYLSESVNIVRGRP